MTLYPNYARSLIATFWWCLLAALFACCVGSARAAVEERREASVYVDVPAGKASQTLRKAARQTDVDILFSGRLLRGIETPEVRGHYTPRGLFEQLLAESQLVVSQHERSGVFVITKPQSAKTADEQANSTDTHTPMQKLKSRLGGAAKAALSIAAVAMPGALAQDAPEDEVFELSPFVVDASNDSGYRAENTMSGGRFNVSLRDTAASTTVFTEQFLEDVGIQSLDELAVYSVGTSLDTGDADSGNNPIGFRSAESTISNIRIRGIRGTQGRNFFQSITPDDGYRNGRYDESRGPNGILFGISNAGGMVSSSTTQASTSRDKSSLKYTTGSYSQNRTEIELNRVLIENRLGVAFAGLYEDSDNWRQWVQDKKKRVYGAVTFKPTDTITLRAMGESGEDFSRQVRPFTFADTFTAWDDNGRPSALPYGRTDPDDSAIEAAGVADQISNNFQGGQRGRIPRHVYIENSGELHNLGGTFRSSNYDNSDVTGGIEQLPGVFGGIGELRVDNQEKFPYSTNFEGSDGTGRTSQFDWWQIDADFKLADNLYLNIAHNKQEIDMENPYLAGQDPQVAGDPNITLGVVPGNPSNPFNLQRPDEEDYEQYLNPFVGRLYVEGDQRFDLRYASSEETRIGVSYHLQPDKGWLGNHRLAVAASRREQVDFIENHILGFTGAPYHSNPDNFNNAVINRYYFDENNPGDFAYRQTLLPYDVSATRMLKVNDIADPSGARDGIVNGGVMREIGWVRGEGRSNNRADQNVDAYLAVTSSSFFDNRLIITAGYRKDEATAFDYAKFNDSRFGFKVDQSAPVSEVDFEGESETIGGVFHLNRNFSFIANYSRSVGLPNFIRRVLPEDYRTNALDVTIPPPSSTGGEDFGINFELFDNKLSGRIVYFETYAKDEETGGIAGNIIRNNSRDIFSVLEDTFLNENLYADGEPLDYSLDEIEGMRQRLTTNVDGILRDSNSQGYELRFVANPTDNWRVTLNASYTDRETSNSYKRFIPWFGYIKDDNGFPLQPLDLNDDGDWEIPETARVTQEGVLQQVFDLSVEAAARAGVSVTEFLNDGGNNSIAMKLMRAPQGQWFRLNDRIQQEEQRWGLRPYRANIFTAYDFKEGPLNGFTLGGGLRWQSANKIGGVRLSQFSPDFDPDVDVDRLVEFEGVDIFDTDLMMRYRFRTERRNTITLQLNVYNVFDNQDIIPQRLATTPDQLLPDPNNLRATDQIALTRYDLVAPRTYRLSAAIDF